MNRKLSDFRGKKLHPNTRDITGPTFPHQCQTQKGENTTLAKETEPYLLLVLVLAPGPDGIILLGSILLPLTLL